MDEDPEELSWREGGAQEARVEAVDPLQHQHVAGTKGDGRAAVRVALAGEEVVVGGPDRLAGQ